MVRSSTTLAPISEDSRIALVDKAVASIVRDNSAEHALAQARMVELVKGDERLTWRWY